MTNQKVTLIATYLRQCYSALNNFGKASESHEDRIRAFSRALDIYTPEQISKAFDLWMRKKSVMPTPSDIIDLIQSNKTSHKSGSIKLLRSYTTHIHLKDDLNNKVLIVSFPQGRSLSPVEMGNRYGDKIINVSMEQDCIVNNKD